MLDDLGAGEQGVGTLLDQVSVYDLLLTSLANVEVLVGILHEGGDQMLVLQGAGIVIDEVRLGNVLVQDL